MSRMQIRAVFLCLFRRNGQRGNVRHFSRPANNGHLSVHYRLSIFKAPGRHGWRNHPRVDCYIYRWLLEWLEVSIESRRLRNGPPNNNNTNNTNNNNNNISQNQQQPADWFPRNATLSQRPQTRFKGVGGGTYLFRRRRRRKNEREEKFERCHIYLKPPEKAATHTHTHTKMKRRTRMRRCPMTFHLGWAGKGGVGLEGRIPTRITHLSATFLYRNAI